MGTRSGRYARLTTGYDTVESIVPELNTWSMNITAGSTDTSSFGDEWGKSDVGILNWSGSAGGFYDPEDTSQSALFDQLVSGTLLQTLRMYTTWTATPGGVLLYWQPDISSDPDAGARIGAYNTGSTTGGVATFDFSFEGSGPIIQVQTTAP